MNSSGVRTCSMPHALTLQSCTTHDQGGSPCVAHPFFFELGLTSCRQDSFSCVLVHFVYIVSDRVHDLAVYLERPVAVPKTVLSAGTAYTADSERVVWAGKSGALASYSRCFQTLLPVTKASHGTDILRSLCVLELWSHSCGCKSLLAMCMQCRPHGHRYHDV